MRDRARELVFVKKDTFRINNTLNIWTKKRTFLVQFRPRSSKPTPLFFALSCLLFRLWRSASLLEIASKRERGRERSRVIVSLARISSTQKKSKGFTKEKHSKAFSFVFPEKRDVKERRISQKSHIMRDFAARASTSFAEGACCVTFFPSREVRSARRDRPTMTTAFVVYVQNHNNNNNGHKNESGIPLGKKRGAKFPPIFCGCFLYPLFFYQREPPPTPTPPTFFFREKEEPIVDHETTSGGPTNHERSARTTTTTNAATFSPVFLFFSLKKPLVVRRRLWCSSSNDIY